MEIFKDYIKNLNKVLDEGNKHGRRARKFLESGHGISGLPTSGTFSQEKREKKEVQLLPSLQEFASTLGVSVDLNQRLGQHPDFANLKSSRNVEQHYIVSMFIDIKGSTNLFKKYHPGVVQEITQIIQEVAIHTSLVFGGYVHRLQGDGLFVYFGGKKTEKKLAVERALQNACVFTYFVKNDLRKIFNEQGVETIYTRIGIDFGDDDEVLWFCSGVGEISEVTTCSLHTSLASKMQNYAESNGVVVGENIKKFSHPKFFSPACNRDKSVPRYIFEIPDENYRYTQYDFNWLQYLKIQPFIATDQYGNIVLKSKAAIQNPENIRSIARRNIPYFANK
ncbi:MAG: hypothetical protein CMN32_16200 [Saprospirales bacterium]|nr:hypothetical protein [Saprospirales bacterium]